MTQPNALQPAVTAALGPALEVYQRLQAIKNALAPDLTDQELQLFALVAERSGLDPFARQIYAVKRKGRVTFQTGIDGFRGTAESTGQYRGSDEPTFGPDQSDGFKHPEWARVVVHRVYPDGTTNDQPGIARWAEFYPGVGDDGFMYRKQPYGQLAKCAEAQALRRAFPKQLGGIYEGAEMSQADAIEAARPVGPTARERIAERRATAEASNPTDGSPPVTPERTRSPLADRLRTRAGEYGDAQAAGQPASDEQKVALRETLSAIEPAALVELMAAAFDFDRPGNLSGPAKVALTQAQAQALLEEYAGDPEAFQAEATA
jgi:phage recombination protein Bet